MTDRSTALPTESTSGSVVLGTGRPVSEVAFEREIVSFFVDSAALLGVPRSVAAIYGLIFASSQPLSFTEIDERLDLSKGSISQGLRILREMGAVRTTVAAGRWELFSPEESLRQLVHQFIVTRLVNHLNVGSARLATVARMIPEQPAEASAVLKRRMKYLAGWHSKARALVPVAKTFLKLGK